MTEQKEGPRTARPKKPSLAQTDVPSYPLRDALRVARAIAAELGKRPGTPLQVAKALGMSPTTGAFRTITASSIAYGLTEGAAFAEKIGLTDLGRRIVAPTTEGDEASGMLEAVMKPRVTAAFLKRYNGSKWPRDDIGRNVLEDEMGVNPQQSARALELIRADADDLGLLVRINDALFVSLDLAPSTPPREGELTTIGDGSKLAIPALAPETVPRIAKDNRRVFITHGKNEKIVEQIRKLLQFGDFEPVVSINTQATAKAVPDKVLDEMRSYAAAIVHVGAEMVGTDKDGIDLRIINPNVLIEIGAALALYGHRFILLVERGVALPSNLQGSSRYARL